MSSHDFEIYYKVAEIVRKVLEYSYDIVKPGAKVLEICEKLERKIIELGAKPAFPVNICINDVAAHYTATINDFLEIPEKSIVKVDVGAHIDGYIVDAAITISFNPIYDKLIRSTYEALKTVSSILKPGITLGKVGYYIEKTIRSYGFKPIENLTGHLIKRYELHAGKSIPNIDNGDERRVLEGEIYAIEPFATDGKGLVIEIDKVTIFRLISLIGKKKVSKKYSNILTLINNECNGLPFTPRWFKDRIQEIEIIINELVKEGMLFPYPVLVEEGKGMVAQSEDTFIVKGNRTEELVHTVELYVK